MSRVLAFAAATSILALAPPAFAQPMDHSSMPGMKMPAKPAAKPRATATPPRATRSPAAVRRVRTVNRAPVASVPVRPGPVDPQAMPGMDMSRETDGKALGVSKNGEAEPGATGTTDSMPSMDMSSSAPPPATHPDCPPEHAKMGHCTPKVAASADAVGTDLPPGDAPAPTGQHATYADRFFPTADMQRARDMMMHEGGGQTFGFVVFNLAEYQPRRGRDAFRWDGEAWYGGDINRLTLKTEGEGKFGEGVEAAEVQALYSRAIDPYFNLQAGIRQDLGRRPRRTYAAIGFEGLAPYWFEVEGTLFLSDKGNLLARLDGYYDQRITQRLILQPRVELNLAAQDIPANRIGAGLSTAEVGLRLRYEIKRQFAPYVGVSWERRVGATARYARAAGEDVTNSGIVAGIRFWF